MRGLETALRGLWLVVGVEFLLRRLLTRVSIYMPKTPLTAALYRLLAVTGEIAFNLSLLAGLLALGYVLWIQVRRGAAGSRAAGGSPVGGGPFPGGTAAHLPAALALAAALLVLLAPGSPPGPGWSLAAAVAMAVAVGGLAALAISRATGWEWRLGLAAILAGHLSWYGVAAAQTALLMSGRGGEVAWATTVLRLGELAAMLAPPMLAVTAWRRVGVPGWTGLDRGMLAGFGGAALLAGGYAANADMTGVLAVWSLGFTLSWPAPVYLAALAAGLYFLVRSAGSPDPATRVRAAALGILWLTGFSLQVNQQHFLVLLSWSLLAAGGHIPGTAPGRGEVRSDG